MAAQTAAWGNALADISGRVLMLFFAACSLAALAATAWLAHKFGVTWTSVGLVLGWLAVASAAMLCVERRLWVAVALIVLALRVAMFFVTDGVLTTNPDPRYYAHLAMEMSHGRDFTDIVSGMALKAHAPRLYSILLAGFYFISDGSRLAPFLLNGAIDGLTGLMIFLVGRQLGAGVRPAVAMAVLYLIWPHIVVSSAFAQKEGLSSLLIMACIWTLARSWGDGRNRGLIYGLFLGLLGLAQPAWFLMTAGLPLVLIVRQRIPAVAKFLAIAALASIVVLTPWIVRNWMVTGGFIPLTSSFGWNLYANAARSMEIPQHLVHLPEAEWSRVMFAEGIAVIAANPVAFAAHQAKMIVTGLALEHGYYLPLVDIQPRPAIAPADFLLVMQLPLVAMWAAAAWSTRGRKDNVLMIAIVTMIILYIATIGIWYQFGQRHRAYLLPVILAWFVVAAGQWRGRTAR